MVAIDHPLLALVTGRSAKSPPPAPASAGVTANPPAAKTFTAETRDFVITLKIGGTIRGTRLQVMVDGLLHAVGDVIDPSSGLMVTKIEDDARRVTFIDTAGRTYTRTF